MPRTDVVRPAVGDRVSVLVPGQYQQFSTVVETDYHPLGIDDVVKIRFEKTIAYRKPTWFDLRYVVKEE